MTHSFRTGDLMEPKDQYVENIGYYSGFSKTGKYEVVGVNTHSVRVRPEGSSDSSTTVFDDSKFKPLVRRVEGEQILPEHIEVGDTIRVSKISGDMTMIHEAVVGHIVRQTDTKNLGTLLFRTSKMHTAQRINWGGGSDETFTLLKAVPERDVLLDRLTGAKAGQVVTYRDSLARKHNDEKWDVVFASRASVVSTTSLRDTIGKSDVVWLKAES